MLIFTTSFKHFTEEVKIPFHNSFQMNFNYGNDGDFKYLPERDEFNSILKNYKTDKSLDMEYIVKQTDKWTGAWINELIKTALTHAIIRDESNTIRQSNICEAIKDIRERRNEARTASGQLTDYYLDSNSNEEVGVF